MNSELLLTSSEFLQENFFTAEDTATEYVELSIQSRFNQFYKVKRFGRWFVLKGLKPEFATDAMYVSLLKKEFDLSVELDHPNIVTTFLKEDNPRMGPAILMEYVDGMTLDEFLLTTPTLKQRQRIVSQMLDAMQYFHSKQIVHRDLKPSNILITRNGLNVKIIDFGLADADSYAIFKQGAGTKNYAAPEQMQQDAKVDCRSDIYSFGLLLREIFPKRYRFISSRCLQINPSHRYADVVQIQKTINWHNLFKKILLPTILSLLFVFVMIVALFHHNNSFEAYPDMQQTILNNAYADIDALYQPYMDSLQQGLFVYREFATLSLSLKSVDQGNILQYYLEQISTDSPFYGNFMSSFVGYAANEYYNEALSIYESLPSFFEEYREKRISDEEFQRLYNEFIRLSQH